MPRSFSIVPMHSVLDTYEDSSSNSHEFSLYLCVTGAVTYRNVRLRNFAFRAQSPVVACSSRRTQARILAPLFTVITLLHWLNPRRACAARVTVVVLCVCVCVCVCPRPSSATDATKRQSRHTGGLSIVFASV